MTLQWRLTLLFFLLTAGALAALGGGAYFVAQERVYGSVDDGLSARSQALTASITASDRPLSTTDLVASSRSLDSQAALGAVFRVLSLDGSPLYSSGGAGGGVGSVSLEPGFRTLEAGEERMRVLLRPVTAAGQPIAYIETSASLRQADDSLASMRQVLAFGGVAVSALSGVLAFFVAGKAVQPVRDIARLAREIERTADFTRRLPEARSAREMQEMSRTFNRMIERVERMVQTQRSFLSDTSHELRRPLTILRTNIDVINDPALSLEERNAVQQEMSEVTDSMSHLLSELLMLARQDEESLQLQRVDLSEVCAGAVKSVSMAYPEHHYQCDLESAIEVLADRERLSRAVSNVVQNAAIYMDGPGEISLNLKANDHLATLRVSDSGPGMAPEDVQRAFERFYRGVGARRARPDGLGLGLAIVKQVIDSHDGTIEIESALGHGTRVIVQIPLLDD